MNSPHLPYIIIGIGLIVDIFAVFDLIKNVLGIGDQLPKPLGILFYVIGCLLLLRHESIWYVVSLLLACIGFYTLVVFSGYSVWLSVKFWRRIRAKHKEQFFTVPSDITAHHVIDKSFSALLQACKKYLESFEHAHPATDADERNLGFLYFHCLDRRYKNAVIRIVSSGKTLVRIGESDPGYITGKHFSKYIAQYVPAADHWEIGKRKEIIIPLEEFHYVPQFVNVVFKEYYNCGENYSLKAELFLNLK